METDVNETTVNAEVDQLKAQVERLERQLGYAQHAVTAYERQLKNIVEKLHEEANNRGMCTEFDDIMDDLGLPRRTREYEVRIEVTHYVTVTVEAASEDEAIQQVEEDDPKQAVLNDLNYSGFDDLTVSIY